MQNPVVHRASSVMAIAAACLLAACSKPVDAPPASGAIPAAESPAKLATQFPFTIGELPAIALRDGGFEPPNDNKVFGVGRTPEDVAAVLSAAGQPTDKLQLSVQPLLVRSEERVLLFDTGAGGNFGPTAGQLPHSLNDAGIDPASVTDIFISHAHGDHVGGLVDAEGGLNFPNATIHMAEPEWQSLSGQTADWQVALVRAIKPKVSAFAPGAQLLPGVVKAVEVKGHTPGHSAYLITSGAASLLYVGDSMHHFVVSVQRPEWTIAFDGDSPTATASRAALIAESAANGQRIYAVHFPFPGIGKMEKHGDGHVWVGESL